MVTIKFSLEMDDDDLLFTVLGTESMFYDDPPIFRITERDWITRDDIEPADTIMGRVSVSLYSELKTLHDDATLIRINGRSYSKDEVSAIIQHMAMYPEGIVRRD